MELWIIILEFVSVCHLFICGFWIRFTESLVWSPTSWILPVHITCQRDLRQHRPICGVRYCDYEVPLHLHLEKIQNYWRWSDQDYYCFDFLLLWIPDGADQEFGTWETNLQYHLLYWSLQIKLWSNGEKDPHRNLFLDPNPDLPNLDTNHPVAKEQIEQLEE